MFRIFLLFFLGLNGVAAEPLDQQALEEFIAYMVRSHEFDGQELATQFASVKRSERILRLVARPAEKAKPWHEYRKIFLTRDRIQRGIEFWDTNAKTLQLAADVYGVPPEIIIAIIGVETSYGRITGQDRVIDALATLAFHYPNNDAGRMKYFRGQLEHYLLMTREGSLDRLSLKGSYAGAMGIPQFMPESYRKYAVDFDGDGQTNIWGDRSDAIGSVANYLKSYGWERGKPIVLAVKIDAIDAAPLVSDNPKPHRPVAEFKRNGVSLTGAEDDALAALFTLEGVSDSEYWLGLNNFYVIMRYNPRTKYAMAVVQLAQAIRDARNGAVS